MFLTKISKHWELTVLYERRVAIRPVRWQAVMKRLGSKMALFVIKTYNYFRKSQAKLARAQRHLSRKKKGSARRKVQKVKVARVYQKIANQRSHFLHQVTNSLISNYDVIVVEDLNVVGMTKNRRLAKSVTDAGFAMCRSILEYKCEWYGKKLVIADRWFPSSKLCSGCGAKKDKLYLSERIYRCDGCGLVIGRDLNAALNLKAYHVRESSTCEKKEQEKAARVGTAKRSVRACKTAASVAARPVETSRFDEKS